MHPLEAELRRELPQAVLRAMKRGAKTPQQIAETASLRLDDVKRSIKRLVFVGAIKPGPEGSAKGYMLTPTGSSVVSGSVAAAVLSAQAVLRAKRPDISPMTLEQARAALAKLRVKSGLAATRERVGDFVLSLGYNRDSEQFYCGVEHTPSGKSGGKMGLERDKDIESRTKSMWMADKTWRLTPAGVEKVIKSLHNVGALGVERPAPIEF